MTGEHLPSFNFSKTAAATHKTYCNEPWHLSKSIMNTSETTIGEGNPTLADLIAFKSGPPRSVDKPALPLELLNLKHVHTLSVLERLTVPLRAMLLANESVAKALNFRIKGLEHDDPEQNAIAKMTPNEHLYYKIWRDGGSCPDIPESRPTGPLGTSAESHHKLAWQTEALRYVLNCPSITEE